MKKMLALAAVGMLALTGCGAESGQGACQSVQEIYLEYGGINPGIEDEINQVETRDEDLAPILEAHQDAVTAFNGSLPSGQLDDLHALGRYCQDEHDVDFGL